MQPKSIVAVPRLTLRFSVAPEVARVLPATPCSCIALRVRELPDDVYAEITRLSREGDEAAVAGRFDDAIVKYESAYALVPESSGTGTRAPGF